MGQIFFLQKMVNFIPNNLKTVIKLENSLKTMDFFLFCYFSHRAFIFVPHFDKLKNSILFEGYYFEFEFTRL